MRIDRLELDFFRNYVHLEAEFDPRVNLIYGESYSLDLHEEEHAYVTQLKIPTL